MNKFLSAAVVALCLLFSACEKVVDISLNNVDKRYVIEGVLTDEPGSCRVRITQTKDFNESSSFPGVSGATVVLSDNGTPVTLEEREDGNYYASEITGVPGHEYKLDVTIGEERFTASSVMPQKVPFDSLYVIERVFFGEVRKIATIEYFDPAGLGNAFRFVQYINGVREPAIFLTNDDYSDNRRVSRQLLVFSDDEEKLLKTGDSVNVDMHCIDNAVYRYWYSIDAATGSGNQATPANPVSNIRGGALGYFSAQTVQRRTAIVE